MTTQAPPSTHHAHTTLARWLTTVPAGAVVKGRARTITRGRSTILVAAAALDWDPTDTEGVTP